MEMKLRFGLMLIVVALGACERDEAIFITRAYPADLLPQGVSSEGATRSVEKSLKQAGFILSEGSTRNYAAKIELRRDTGTTGDDHWTMRVVLAPRDGG